MHPLYPRTVYTPNNWRPQKERAVKKFFTVIFIAVSLLAAAELFGDYVKLVLDVGYQIREDRRPYEPTPWH